MNVLEQYLNGLYAGDSNKPAYITIGYTLNESGDIISETETDGSYVRTRTWTYTLNADNSVSAVASDWSYI